MEKYRMSARALVAIVIVISLIYGATGVGVMVCALTVHLWVAALLTALFVALSFPLVYFGRALMVVAVEGAVALRKAKDAGEF